MARRAAALAGVVVTLAVALVAGSVLLNSGVGVGASRDADAINLENLGRQARQHASAVVTAPVLRQVDVDLRSGRTIFMFIDAAATVEVDVDIPAGGDSSPEQWQVQSTTFSKLTGLVIPAMNLSVLRVGPALVGANITHYWSGCTPGFATLYGKGDDIKWTAFCTLPDGALASGDTDVRSGKFAPSLAPPANPPPTAPPA